MDYDDFTVRFSVDHLSSGDLDFVQELLDIPPAEVLRLQRGLDRAAKYMAYGRAKKSKAGKNSDGTSKKKPATKGDAFQQLMAVLSLAR